MRARLFSLLLLVLGLALASSGCLQSSSVDRCKDSADHDGCLAFYATWYQEPETCYFINDMPARQECLTSATTPEASSRLQNSYAAYGRVPTPTVKKPTANTTKPVKNTTTTGGPSTPSKPAPAIQISKCVLATPKATNDTCAKQLAAEQGDLTFCTFIVSQDLRSACILSVANTLKDPTACSVFESSTDRQFCTYYSSAH